MKRLTLLAFGGLLSACGGVIRVHAVAPEPVVTVVAEPAPPPPVVTEAPPAAEADVSVEVAPEVTTAEPVEVTATTEPPDPIYEEEPAAPSPGYYWVGGYWGWTGSDWGWYSGRWLAAPEGRVYIEPYYERVGPNVVYVGGYWGPRDAPRRSYGGERIQIGRPSRPADYRPGERPRFERKVGAAPGSRPPTAYVRATGAPRPLPRTTVPAYRAETREAHPVAHAEAHPVAHAEPARPPERDVHAAHEGPAEVRPAHEGAMKPEERAAPERATPPPRAVQGVREQGRPGAPEKGPAPRSAQMAPRPAPAPRPAAAPPKKKKE
jgi:hypothetical protein